MATTKKRSGYTWVKGSKGRKGHWRKKAKRRTLSGLKGCAVKTTMKPAGVVGLGKVKRKKRKTTKRKTLRGVGEYIKQEAGVSGLSKTRKKRKTTTKRKKTLRGVGAVKGLAKVKRKKSGTKKKRTLKGVAGNIRLARRTNAPQKKDSFTTYPAKFMER